MLGELFGGFRAWTQVFVCDGVLSFKTLAWVDLQMVLLVRGQLVNASERLLVISWVVHGVQGRKHFAVLVARWGSSLNVHQVLVLWLWCWGGIHLL